MKTDQIKLLYEYNDWADQHILTQCANVTAEQFSAPPPDMGITSLHLTLVHLVDAMRLWRTIFEGFHESAENKDKYDEMELKEADLPTFAAVEERWKIERQTLWAYLNGLTDERLAGTVRYTLSNGMVRERALWHCLLHLANHATQHRSEAAALLTSYGQSPGDLDFTRFLNEHFNLPS